MTMTTTNKTNLREIRINKGMTLKELERRTGLSYQTLWRIETGADVNYLPVTRQKIADALGVKVSDIFLD